MTEPRHASRAERRRLARHEAKRARRQFKPDADYGVQVGWFKTLADLPEARRSTHDSLVKSMGAMRTGPVQWRWATGKEAHDLLDSITENADEAAANYYRQVRAHLREWDGYVIVAAAEGKRP